MLKLRKMNKEDVAAQWKHVAALPADENGFTSQYAGREGHLLYYPGV